uniref:NADH-ubiquinone oxidoreductase chain 5 n=1 Tax=Mecinus janthinus TaxID=1071889 RepID=A0A343C4Y1_9CUCU|nr:NADH dehydrogenase subunit 5 [Mecinus janthinus]
MKFISCNFYFVSFLLTSVIFYLLGIYLLLINFSMIFIYKIMFFNSTCMSMVWNIDWVSSLFCSFVFFISSMVLKYSEEYMCMEKNLSRFLLMIIMFVFSMVFLIISPNLISILLGWDGLGLISYSLVIFYQNVKSFNAGMLTALMNRLGDSAFLISISIMSSYGSWNFLNYLDVSYLNKVLFLVGIFIVFAAMTKSAQIPFSSWLPAAMAAPTPVSSLVHSSTLVTAGVYLLFRFMPGLSHQVLEVLLYLSLLTMFMAGLAANFEFDLKKIIALSTLSQLGMMIMILCLGNSDLAFFHLLIHALFKALLFMCAGAMIHNMGNFQDIRFMGSIGKFMPLTCVCFNISNFALCGLPFLSGFYSKDLIAESILSMEMLNMVIFVVFFISVGLTVSYTIRLTYYILFGTMNYLSLIYFSDNNNKIMLKGMFGLVVLVIFKGSFLIWILFPTPYFILLPFYMKIVTLLVIFIGAFLGYEMNKMNYLYNNKSFGFYNSTKYFAEMWNMPIISTLTLNSYFLLLGKSYFKTMDQGWMEYYGSKNMYMSMKFLSQFLQNFSINHLKIFLLIFLTFVLTFFMYFL